MCNEISNKEKKALKSIPIGTNANNNQTVRYNSATGKFEFTNLPNGFDQNADYNLGGAWDFEQIPTVGGNNLALRSDLNNYATTGALAAGLAGKVDNATLANYATTAALAAGLASKADTSVLANYVSKTANETIDGSKTFSQQVNMALGLQLKYQSAPTGAASNTTLYADSTGRLCWRNGTGFTRTFDGTSITANRTWSMPDADTTLAGLSVNQTFTAQQIFTSGTYVAGNSFFGNNTALINSVGKAGFGIATALTATLTAQGDGTNPVAIFQNSTSSNILTLNSNANTLTFSGTLASRFTAIAAATSGFYFGNVASLTYTGSAIQYNINGIFGNSAHIFNASNITNTTGTYDFINIVGNVLQPLGSANYRHLSLNYTINNSDAQTGAATGILLNATETALKGMTHNLVDLKVGGTSRFIVSNSGALFNPTGGIYTGAQVGRIGFGFVNFNTNGIILLNNASENDFTRLQFGGTGPTAPALKKNGAELQVKLADDSAMANFAANIITAYGKVNLASSSTTAASMNIKAGTAPTTPIDGDIWFDGTDLYMRVAGANKRFTTTG